MHFNSLLPCWWVVPACMRLEHARHKQQPYEQDRIADASTTLHQAECLQQEQNGQVSAESSRMPGTAGLREGVLEQMYSGGWNTYCCPACSPCTGRRMPPVQ